MNNQSKQLVVDALLKVIDAAPVPNTSSNAANNNDTDPIYSTSDVPKQQFEIWVDYAKKILDITHDYISVDAILSAKIDISQISAQYGISNKQRIEQIKNVLLNLSRTILWLS